MRHWYYAKYDRISKVAVYLVPDINDLWFSDTDLGIKGFFPNDEELDDIGKTGYKNQVTVERLLKSFSLRSEYKEYMKELDFRKIRSW